MRALLTRATLRKPEAWACAIVVLAAVLRLYRRAPVWPSSDAADVPEFVRDRVCSESGLQGLADLVNYRLGGVQPVVNYVEMLFLRVLGVRVGELAWELPSIVLGCAAAYVAYLIGRHLVGSAAGLAAAALLAVSPLNIMESRHLGAPWMYEEFLQLFIVWLLLRLHSSPSQSLKAAVPVAVGVYVWSGNQMMGMAPVLAYAVLAGARERLPGDSLKAYLAERYLTPWWVFPIASTGLLLYEAVVLHKGHLFHALFEKRHELGWYGENWWQDLTWALSRTGVWFAVVGFILSLFTTRRVFSLQRVPLAMFIAYTAPFLFSIPPGSTFTRGYIVYGVNALLLLWALAVFRIPGPRAIGAAATCVFAVLLFVGAGQSAYGLWKHPLIGTRGFHGSYTQNVGFKAAAAWVRAHGQPGDRVFSDASGGAGLEPPLVAMYFNMPHYSLYDAPELEPYRKFRSKRDIAFLVVKTKNRGLATRYFGTDFHEAAIVSTPERGDVLVIFDRGHQGPPDRVSSAQADRDFERKYSLLCR
jgi:hypothetical protein